MYSRDEGLPSGRVAGRVAAWKRVTSSTCGTRAKVGLARKARQNTFCKRSSDLFQAATLPATLPEGSPSSLEYMFQALKGLNIRNMQEVLNDVIFYRDETRRLFDNGKVTLRQRSLCEQIFWTTLNEIQNLSLELKIAVSTRKFEFSAASRSLRAIS